MQEHKPNTHQKSVYTVLKPFRVKTSGGDKEIVTGMTLNLTLEKARDLMLQGLIIPSHSNGILVEWRTESGRFIYLANTPLAASAAPPGRAVFLWEELEGVRGLDRQAVETVIDTKEVFAGCVIVKTDIGRSE